LPDEAKPFHSLFVFSRRETNERLNPKAAKKSEIEEIDMLSRRAKFK